MSSTLLLRVSLLCSGLALIGGQRLNVTFWPRSLDSLLVGETATIRLDYVCDDSTAPTTLLVDSDDSRIAWVSNSDPIIICPGPDGSLNITVEARFIGKAKLLFRFARDGHVETETTREYRVIVIRVRSQLMKIFIAVTAILMIILNVGFGCSIDMEVIREILQKPIAPVIGALCQFLLMPLVSVYCMIHLLFFRILSHFYVGQCFV